MDANGPKFKLGWLGFNPVFTTQQSASPQMLAGNSLSALGFDKEGLSLYLSFGYSVFGTTPRMGRTFHHDEFNAEFDTAWDMLESSSHFTETEIPWVIRSRIREAFEHSDDLLILPLSGGFDSRLLLWATRDIPRERLFAFSYGTSFPQSKSSEIVIAQSMAHHEKIRWERIELGNFNRYWDEWLRIHGHVSHAHGMYHIEFFSKIRELIGDRRATVISGLLGDLFAGAHRVKPIAAVADLDNLNLSHGLRQRGISSKRTLEQSEAAHEYLAGNKERLENPEFRLIALARMKMMLLRYLIQVPESLGFQVLAPLAEMDIATSMLRLDGRRRKGRVWQRDFFESQGLGHSQASERGLANNSLDYQSIACSGEHIPKIQNLTHAEQLLRQFGMDPAILLEEWRPSKIESTLSMGSFGGSKKSALLNLFPELSPTLKSYKTWQLWYPLLCHLK